LEDTAGVSGFFNSVTINNAGSGAYVGFDGNRGNTLYYFESGRSTAIATQGGEISAIDYFRSAVGMRGRVVFRARDAKGACALYLYQPERGVLKLIHAGATTSLSRSIGRVLSRFRALWRSLRRWCRQHGCIIQ
jgi:hypothetical protein